MAIAVAGCAMVKSNIAVFHELPARAEPIKYAALPLKEQEGSLEHKAYEQQIKAALRNKGFVETSVDDAEVILFFEYGIDSGKETVSSYPIIGRTGTASSYTSGTATAYGNYATYSGTTYNTPTYGVVGTGVRSDTVFSRFLRLDLIDKASLVNGKIKKVYEAKVSSEGASGQLAAVMPTMIKALFEDFPGKSGSTRRAMLPVER
ncbi:MAG: DUF4136 domain-containing protein [Pseudomonadota bacterium]